MEVFHDTAIVCHLPYGITHQDNQCAINLLPDTIHKADGSPCQSETETLERWREHFEAALNHPAGTPSPDLDAEAENDAADISTSIDEPSLDEVITAIRKLKNGRAPGPDGIPAELLIFAIMPVARALHSIFLSVWRTARIPCD